MQSNNNDASTPDRGEIAGKLLAVIAELSEEMRPQSGSATVTLDSALDRDLGFDSLARTELLLRVGRAFQVSLPDETLVAETPRDLLRAVLAASGVSKREAAAELRFEGPAATESLPTRARTLTEALDWHAQAHPDRTHVYLYNEPEVIEQISYAALREGALAVAAGLRERGLEPGQAVAIMLPTGSAYFFSYFGALFAGGIPVPIYPPVRPSQIEEHLRRHVRILGSARTVILITVTEAMVVARLLKPRVESLRHIVTPEELQMATEGASHAAREQDVAFLQYTSGSTGDPKGVILTHANLLANLRAAGTRLEASSTDVFVSWLPLYHDMGLIGAWLGSLYYGFPAVIMSPLHFLARPARWLWAIHRHHGTMSASPNFGYELCLRKIADEDIEGLDLGSWRIAANGAEPVSPDTMAKFSERFSAYGLRAEAMMPVYGLAESTVGLAMPRPGTVARVDRVQRDVFGRTGQALPAADDDPHPLLSVACGQPLAGEEIRIVDGAGIEVPERQEGRLEFRGPSSTSGYFANPAATRDLFHDDWLDSGDRAYFAEGELYITGRVKDIIIRGGRNIHPYELEEAIGELPGIRKGCVAAFGSDDPRSGTERLVVVAETRESGGSARGKLRADIRNRTLDLVPTPPDEILLVAPHTVLKTSSGKIRRAAIRDLYEHGILGTGPGAVWRQFARLLWATSAPRIRRGTQVLASFLYATYAWTLFGLMWPLSWGAMLILPQRSWRWGFNRAAVRLLSRLTRIRLIVRGLEHVPDREPFIMVANHASYLDVYILTAAIPANLSYVAKGELKQGSLMHWYLKRLGTVFVERFDQQRSAEDAQRVTEVARAGQSLGFFPEGTFTRKPGVLPFHMGAFVAAAQANVPVLPVTLRGTRSILRDETWLPRRRTARVIIGEPLRPRGSDWQAAVKLRDAARETIVRDSGEPDLGVEPLGN